MKYLLTILLLLLLCSPLFPFGKNKVIYYSYDWDVLESPHYRIYVTKENLSESNLIIGTAEEIFAHHTNAFDYIPKTKIRVILYPNQIDFQQNNIIDWIGPGTGGFTEFVKGRVALPYSAFYSDFHHVMSHELNHAFQGYRWGKGEISPYALRDIDIPLWMIEGASEYNSIGLDKECEMMIADGLIYGILPSLKQLSDLYNLDDRDYFYVYKEGQMFYHFAEKKYGTDIYKKINDSITSERSYPEIISNTFGKTPDELDAEFLNYIRKKYMPVISNLESPEIAAKKIMREDSFFNMNPVYLPSNRIAFISDRKIYPSIVVYDKAKDDLSSIIRGGFDEDFLEFQYGKNNNLSVSTNGILCFVSRSGGEDAIHLYSLNKKKIEKLPLPFRIIYSPDISQDGNRIIFSAVKNDQTDIYLYDRNTKELTQIFDDSYSDKQPRFLDGNKIIFVSNRKRGISSPDMDLFVYDVQNKTFVNIISGDSSIEYPAVTADSSKIAFIKMDLHPALMIYDLNKKVIYEELIPTGGVFTPSFDSNGNVLLTAYHKNSYNIFEYTPRYQTVSTNFKIENKFNENNESLVSLPPLKKSRYQPEYSIDNLFAGFMINSSFGIGALGLLRFSDLLGDERYQLLMDTALQFNQSFWNYLNIDFSYMSLKYRHNYGYRIFHYSNYFYELSTFQEFFNMERPYYKTYGGFLQYSYPFTTFDRIEAETGYHYFSYIQSIVPTAEGYDITLTDRDRNLINISYIHDSTLSDITGPVDGFRYEVLLSKSFPLTTQSMNYEKIVLDFRDYFLIYPGYSLAFRAVGGKVFDTGRLEYPFYIGGFNSVRGFPLWGYSGDNMFVFNLELRVPFIRDWTLGFPFPIRMPTIWGAVFSDFGSAWRSEDQYYLYEYNGNYFSFKDFKCGFGFGLRLVLLPGIKLMVDWASPFDGSSLKDFSQWENFWLIGIDF